HPRTPPQPARTPAPTVDPAGPPPTTGGPAPGTPHHVLPAILARPAPTPPSLARPTRPAGPAGRGRLGAPPAGPAAPAAPGRQPPTLTLPRRASSQVHRADVRTTIRAGGVTESASNTGVECELERLEMRNEGRSSTVGGSSVIPWLIEDGTDVKKGDVFCRLDS